MKTRFVHALGLVVLGGPLLARAQDSPEPHPWVAALEVPKLFEVELNFGYEDSALDVGQSYSLGFEGGPQELLEDAKKRIEGGEESARVLHQLVVGLRRAERFERQHLQILEACYGGFEKEIEEAPDDLDLRMHFASALRLGFNIGGPQELFDGAREQLEAACELAPGDFRIRGQLANLYVNGYARSARLGEPKPALLTAALSEAQAGVDVAPGSVGAHWRQYSVRHVTTLMAREPEGFLSLAGWMGELADRAQTCEDGEMVVLYANACWLAFHLGQVHGEATGGEVPEGLPRAEPEVIERRLTTVFEGLEDAPMHPVLPRIALTAWGVQALLHEPSMSVERMEAAVAAGVPRTVVLSLGVGLHQLGRRYDGLSELLVQLESISDDDRTREALAAYYHRADDNARALEALGALERRALRHDLAEAIVWLRVGREKAALEQLARLAEAEAGAPQPDRDAPLLSHAYGVALALAGRHAEAIPQLEAAVASLPEPAAAAEALRVTREALDRK